MLKILLSLVLLTPSLLLVLMSSYTLFSLLLVGTHFVYAGAVVGGYLRLKAQEKLTWLGEVLFFPLLLFSGTLGLVVWVWLRPPRSKGLVAETR